MVTSQQHQCTTNFLYNYIESLLQSFSQWQATTTVINLRGCIFEYKGVFPTGRTKNGYYQLEAGLNGFCGYIPIHLINKVTMQEKTHCDRDSYAICFFSKNDCLFKIFLGHDASGKVYQEQLSEFFTIKEEVSMIGLNK